MGIVRFRTEDLIDPDTEAQYVFIHSIKATSTIHRHDFYEVFLVVRGSVDHVANYRKQHLTEGSLVFVRPDDAHYYARDPDSECQFINLAFPQYTADALFAYLGPGLHPERLLSGDVPPCVQLTKCESNTVMTMLEEFDVAQRTKCAGLARMKLRAMLIDIFVTYFSPDSHERKNSKPDWLVTLCREMQSKDNLAEGIPAMVRITGMTHEYLCRQFKIHLKMTPGEYVNGLRLHYAHNLLQQNEEKILSIAMEVGYDSLSHFYHVFKKQYGISPAACRKQSERT
jgi:AraC family transcriptional regulator, dual regulator of chb operon